MHPKISVIIPVYNTEQYLYEAISSITQQTLPDIEIICVNDGSTDSSREILGEFAKKDSRIVLIDQENKGLSGARNTGLAKATGEYIYFFDSDDVLERDALEVCYQECVASNLDILYFDAHVFYTTKALESRFPHYKAKFTRNVAPIGVVTGQQMLVHMKDKFLVPVWVHLYRRDFIQKHQLSFYEGIIYEDNLFSMKAALLAVRVQYKNRVLFHYRIRENSIMTRPLEVRNVRSYFICYFELLLFLKEITFENKEVLRQVSWQMKGYLNTCKRFYRQMGGEVSFQELENPMLACLFYQLIENQTSEGQALLRKGFSSIADHGFFYTAKLAFKRLFGRI